MIARLAFYYPDEFKLIEVLWSVGETKPFTVNDRLERIEREAAAIRREMQG